jgi:hypothetical protein
MGKTGVLVDASLETTKDAAAAQQANGADFAANAFDDLTDKANEDFICALRLGPVDDYADVSARRTLMINTYFVCCIRYELSAQLRKINTFNGRTFNCSSQPRYLQVSFFHMFIDILLSQARYIEADTRARQYNGIVDTRDVRAEPI